MAKTYLLSNMEGIDFITNKKVDACKVNGNYTKQTTINYAQMFIVFAGSAKDFLGNWLTPILDCQAGNKKAINAKH